MAIVMTWTFVLVAPSALDLYLFYLLPAVAFSRGGYMKNPWSYLGHMVLSGIAGMMPSYAALNFSTE